MLQSILINPGTLADWLTFILLAANLGLFLWQLAQNQKASEQEYRPYVGITNVSLIWHSPTSMHIPKFTVQVLNTGRSPACDLTIRFRYVKYDYSDRSDFSSIDDLPEPVEHLFFAKNMLTPSVYDEIYFPDGLEDGIGKGFLGFTDTPNPIRCVFYGDITYSGIEPKGKRYSTSFCYTCVIQSFHVFEDLRKHASGKRPT
jgi:hypothetical protein